VRIRPVGSAVIELDEPTSNTEKKPSNNFTTADQMENDIESNKWKPNQQYFNYEFVAHNNNQHNPPNQDGYYYAPPATSERPVFVSSTPAPPSHSQGPIFVSSTPEPENNYGPSSTPSYEDSASDDYDEDDTVVIEAKSANNNQRNIPETRQQVNPTPAPVFGTRLNKLNRVVETAANPRGVNYEHGQQVESRKQPNPKSSNFINYSAPQNYYPSYGQRTNQFVPEMPEEAEYIPGSQRPQYVPRPSPPQPQPQPNYPEAPTTNQQPGIFVQYYPRQGHIPTYTPQYPTVYNQYPQYYPQGRSYPGYNFGYYPQYYPVYPQTPVSPQPRRIPQPRINPTPTFPQTPVHPEIPENHQPRANPQSPNHPQTPMNQQPRVNPNPQIPVHPQIPERTPIQPQQPPVKPQRPRIQPPTDSPVYFIPRVGPHPANFNPIPVNPPQKPIPVNPEEDVPSFAPPRKVPQPNFVPVRPRIQPPNTTPVPVQPTHIPDNRPSVETPNYYPRVVPPQTTDRPAYSPSSPRFLPRFTTTVKSTIEGLDSDELDQTMYDVPVEDEKDSSPEAQDSHDVVENPRVETTYNGEPPLPETTESAKKSIIISRKNTAQEARDNQKNYIRLLTERQNISEVGFGTKNCGHDNHENHEHLESGVVRTRVISATPAPRNVKTGERISHRRIVISEPVETVQEIEVLEPVQKESRSTTTSKPDHHQVPVYPKAVPPAFANSDF
jgi:hypothetical protein